MKCSSSLLKRSPEMTVSVGMLIINWNQTWRVSQHQNEFNSHSCSSGARCFSKTVSDQTTSAEGRSVRMGSRWWDCLWKSSRNRSGLLWDSLFVMAPNVVTLRQNQTSASLNWTHVEKLILSRNQIIFLTTVWFWELLEPAWVYKSECGSVLKQRVSPVSGTPWFQQ